jgi:hypothetical protein
MGCTSGSQEAQEDLEEQAKEAELVATQARQTEEEAMDASPRRAAEV